MIVIPTGSVEKLNSYILQSSCRGGMLRMIRSDTAHLAHIHGYQHITIYIHSAFATNASLSILSVQPCMHPHTTLSPLTYTYALPATTTYVLLNQRHYLQMIISRSKEFVDHNHCKAKLHKISKNCLSEKFHAMQVVYAVRTYSDTMHEK